MTDSAILKAVENARQKLLDTGTRNPLIHVNRANRRLNRLNIINERSDDVFRILRVEKKTMHFKATGTNEQEDNDLEIFLAPSEERYVDRFLETPLTPEGQARRLLRIARDAKTAEEEQGINILYLALGFLRWKEGKDSSKEREAPLILLPVELVRDKRSSTYKIQVREEDISTNLSLQERLRHDYGIELPEVNETEKWSPSDYFAQLEETIAGQASWSVDANGMQLGFFSFVKLLMHRDLDPKSWPDDAFMKHALLSDLLGGKFTKDSPPFDPDKKLDDLFAPADIIQIVDADASQTKVVEEARKGSSLVIQGPPGTGKSQTITNIIAAAVHDGKTVLFVSEKMAALSVVHNRLEKAGLQDICLELHSRKTNKKMLAQELDRVLKNATAPTSFDSDTAEQLKIQRDELNQIADLLHKPLRPSGNSAFETLSELIGLMGANIKPPSIPLKGLATLSQEKRKSIGKDINRFKKALEQTGMPKKHPFYGTRKLDLQPPDLERLKEELRQAIGSIEQLQSKTQEEKGESVSFAPESLADIKSLGSAIADLDSIPNQEHEAITALYEHATKPRMREALSVGRDWRNERDNTDKFFTPQAYTADVFTLRSVIERGCDSFFVRRLSISYRRACAKLENLLSSPLPKSPHERLKLVDQLIKTQKLRQKLSEHESWLHDRMNDVWRGEQTPFSDFLDLCGWLGKSRKKGIFQTAEEIIIALQAFPQPTENADTLQNSVKEARKAIEEPINRLDLDLQKIRSGANLGNTSLTTLRRVFEDMFDSCERYQEWAELMRTMDKLKNNSAIEVVKAVLSGRLEARLAANEFAYACAEARLKSARKSHRQLVDLDGLNRHEIVTSFCFLEQKRLQETKNFILTHYRKRVPRDAIGEMKILLHEIKKTRAHKPIRWLMKNTGSSLQKIKPVMLMSPVSVAQFLPPGKLVFDLLVIDEASQVRPEDALGVIARTKQILVVGDQKQLPPTSFFDRLVHEDEGDEEEAIPSAIEGMESILSLCEASGLRQKMLEWHYRSRDSSLIRVSNKEFYDNKLVLPPSPLERDDNYGLKFRQVPGTYARGSKRTNKIEAEKIVDAVEQYSKNFPTLSLGIVAFSKAQSDMIEDILEYRRRNNSNLDDFFARRSKRGLFREKYRKCSG